jgi:hypothetical protein
MVGSYNDINLLQHSHVLARLVEVHAQEVNYEIK